MAQDIKILYVDDEKDLLEIGEIFLKKMGDFQVFTSTSARDVLENFPIMTFDVIISDYQMPGMDGIEFLKEVRKSYGDIPFILFTGRGREEVVIKAINNGADFYLQKGGDARAQFTELIHKINQAVKRKTTEDELILLKASVDQAYDEVFWLDFNGNFLYVNEAACHTTGYPFGELINMQIFDLSPYLSRSLWDKFVIKLKQEKRVLSTTRHKRKNGTLIDVEVMSSYVKKDGKEYSFAFVRDITKLKRKEEEFQRRREYLENILSSAEYGIVIIDAREYGIVDTNPAMAEMLGVSKDHIIGMKYHDLMGPADFSQCQSPSLHQIPEKCEGVLILRGGKKVPILKYASRFTFNGIPYLLVTFFDISEFDNGIIQRVLE